MFQTDYIVTCDQAGCDGGEDGRPARLHTLKEFGPVAIGFVWKRLHKAGWSRVAGLETCPACNRRLWTPAKKTRGKKT